MINPRYPFGAQHTTTMETAYSEVTLRDGICRVQMPIYGDAWLLTNMRGVKQALSSPDLSRALANRLDSPRLSKDLIPESALMALDPPEHTHVRRLLTPIFTVARIETLRASIADDAVAAVRALETHTQPGDLVERVFRPIAGSSVLRLIGLRDGDLQETEHAAGILRRLNDPTADRADARAQIERFVNERIALAGQGTDALSGLRQAISQGRVSRDQAVNLIVSLLVGGIGSSTIFMSNACYVLLADRQLYSSLADRPDILPHAIEELLRFVPTGVGGGFTRRAIHPTTIAGHHISAGEVVLPSTTAANRDPAVFSDPDIVDFGRASISHVAFGHGVHRCIGAHLARVQAQETFRALTGAWPWLRLDENGAVNWVDGPLARQVSRLNAHWT